VSKKKRRCIVTYLTESPEEEREFFIRTTVMGLMARGHADLHPPRPPQLARVQFGEMVERRIE
jgi:hypothetical protein